MKEFVEIWTRNVFILWPQEVWGKSEKCRGNSKKYVGVKQKDLLLQVRKVLRSSWKLLKNSETSIEKFLKGPHMEYPEVLRSPRNFWEVLGAPDRGEFP